MTNINTVKSFWDSRPCNIKHSTLEIGSKEYFDEVEARKYFVEPHILSFAEFKKWNGKKVLEIGCGIGTASMGFIRNGANYTGVDLSEKSIEIAKQRLETYNVKGELISHDCEKLSEVIDESQKYDLIYSFGVIHHTPNPKNIIKEIRKFLKPDGELRIMLYAKNSWKNFMIEFGYDQPEAQTGCPIAHTYNEDDVKDLLEGFEVTSITQDHIFPYIIEDYVKYKYNLQPWFAKMPIDMFKNLEKKLGWHMLIKAKLSS